MRGRRGGTPEKRGASPGHVKLFKTFRLPVVQCSDSQHYSKLLPIRRMYALDRMSFLVKIGGSSNTLLPNVFELTADNFSISNLSKK